MRIRLAQHPWNQTDAHKDSDFKLDVYQLGTQALQETCTFVDLIHVTLSFSLYSVHALFHT